MTRHQQSPQQQQQQQQYQQQQQQYQQQPRRPNSRSSSGGGGGMGKSRAMAAGDVSKVIELAVLYRVLYTSPSQSLTTLTNPPLSYFILTLTIVPPTTTRW